MNDISSKHVGNVSDLNESRLWKALDSIANRLTTIEKDLSEIIRLSEKVNHHDQIINRHTIKLESHDRRIHEGELWQAKHSDNDIVEKYIVSFEKEIKEIKAKVISLETSKVVNLSNKELYGVVIKWLFGILAAVLIFKITSGLD